MLDKTRFSMLVRRISPMSADGYNRLKTMSRLNFKKEVYKPIEKVTIDTEHVYDEKTLASFLLHRFGPGKYDAVTWDLSTHRLKGQLFVVEIYGSPDEKMSYEFLSNLGIARRAWFITE